MKILPIIGRSLITWGSLTGNKNYVWIVTKHSSMMFNATNENKGLNDMTRRSDLLLGTIIYTEKKFQ